MTRNYNTKSLAKILRNRF